MPAMIPANDTWNLKGSVAELHRGPLSARVDVTRPDLGLQQLQFKGHELRGHLLAVQRDSQTSQADSPWPLPLADAYVRGDDLVASYKPTDDWPYSPQLYWSANPLEGIDGLLGSLSLLISVETHLLDTWPRITVTSQLKCEKLLQVTPTSGTTNALQGNYTVRASNTACCILHRLDSSPISYVEIMPASDFRELTVRQDASGEMRVEWHVFADFLEKGVIRRSRLQTAFLPRANDVQLALACCEATNCRPLPLTT